MSQGYETKTEFPSSSRQEAIWQAADINRRS